MLVDLHSYVLVSELSDGSTLYKGSYGCYLVQRAETLAAHARRLDSERLWRVNSSCMKDAGDGCRPTQIVEGQ